MKFKYLLYLSGLLFISACTKQEAPVISSISPEFGFEETLITVEGMNFENILSINFDEGIPANFNPSYASENAVLFRVPENAVLGDNTIEITTEGGVVTFPFRVTLKPPTISDFYPESASPGETVTIIGENFFEPLEVLFFDSISANIIFSSEDSIVAEVPENVMKGQIKVKANGGPVSTPRVFFTTTEILVNDFDGNGLRSETNRWIFYGAIDQNAGNAIQNSDPAPIDNNFLKISGRDPGTVWIGGTENHSFDIASFEVFPITTDLNNTFLEIDVNNNGKDFTHLILVMVERNGSINDFSTTVLLDEEGWHKFSLPLNRFTDLDGFTIDPQKIRAVKFHLINNEGSNQKLEANIDNVKFVQIN
jgi:hypothetical protein